MFFVFGENQNSRCEYGTGETLEKAIFNWACSAELHDIYDEFQEYKPKVIQGEYVAVTMEVTCTASYTVQKN